MTDRHERFRSMYERYRRNVTRFFVNAFRVTEEDAQDLTQETFTRFYEALGEYRGDARWAYLETIARNVGINHVRAWRTAKRSAEMVEIDDPNNYSMMPAAKEEPDYAERQHQALRRKQLHDAIATLSPGQRQCLQLYLEEFKYHEIAKTLRISLDAVRSRIRDAKRLLRERLGDAAALPEDDQ
jgi:RNA polymerase sigma factor (sigma-70 family)